MKLLDVWNRLFSGTWLALLAALLPMPALMSAEPKAPKAGELRVMSFNIRYGTAPDGDNAWTKRREMVVRTIADFGPDLLGVQEALDFQIDYLAEKLKGYETLGVGRDDGKSEGEFSSVFYKTERFEKLDGGTFWLSQTPDKPGSKSWDSSLPRVVTWVKLKEKKRNAELHFFNTHFDHRGREARRRGAELLRKRIDALGAKASVIVTGDFNCAEDDKPHSILVGKDDAAPKLTDSFRRAHPERGQDEATFHGFTGVKRGARIDWILHTADWKTKESAIERREFEGRYPSDHYPVTAVLERAN
ncbi:MAG: endonuclease/exonuclease/phosphatase family protein [Planctomycetia bacterium]|nr:endonuclease/exonuclease/phosphatase family protein [Planctomycetia bacterium]